MREGVCLGMQLAVVEFSRNVLGWQDANSTEFDPNTNHPVVIDMPEHNPGQMGGTMRLGKRRTLFQTTDSVMRKLYGDADYLEERHRHRFEVNPVLKKCLEEQGLKFVGQDVEGERMEIVELEASGEKQDIRAERVMSGRQGSPSVTALLQPPCVTVASSV
eukprot:bmy_19253T0